MLGTNVPLFFGFLFGSAVLFFFVCIIVIFLGNRRFDGHSHEPNFIAWIAYHFIQK